MREEKGILYPRLCLVEYAEDRQELGALVMGDWVPYHASCSGCCMGHRAVSLHKGEVIGGRFAHNLLSHREMVLMHWCMDVEYAAGCKINQ